VSDEEGGVTEGDQDNRPLILSKMIGNGGVS